MQKFLYFPVRHERRLLRMSGQPHVLEHTILFIGVLEQNRYLGPVRRAREELPKAPLHPLRDG